MGLQKYHYINIQDGFNISLDEVEKNGKSRIIATSCRDVIEEYLGSNQRLDVKNEKRLVVNNK